MDVLDYKQKNKVHGNRNEVNQKAGTIEYTCERPRALLHMLSREHQLSKVTSKF